jgi:hypothetical protein
LDTVVRQVRCNLGIITTTVAPAGTQPADLLNANDTADEPTRQNGGAASLAPAVSGSTGAISPNCSAPNSQGPSGAEVEESV